MAKRSTLPAPTAPQNTRQFLMDRRDKICAKLPAGVDSDSIFQKLLIELDNNPDLYKCDPTSLIRCLIEATTNGLEIGGVRHQAYIVPYGRTAKLIPSYLGYIALLEQTGKLRSATFECVHECDKFSWTLGIEEDLLHVPSIKPDRASIPITHVYVVFRLADGVNVINVWTKPEIELHKEQYSKGWQRSDSPWQTAWRQMAIKTVVLDTFHRGRLPMNQSLMQFVERERIVTEQGILDSSVDLAEFEPPPSIIDQTPPPPKEETPQPLDRDAFVRAVSGAKSVADVNAVRDLYAGQIDDAELDAICTDREEQIKGTSL